MSSIQKVEGKKDTPTKTVSEKALMVGLLHKGFQRTTLKVLKELKEDVEKVKETMYKQSGNIKKKARKSKKKPKKKFWSWKVQ